MKGNGTLPLLKRLMKVCREGEKRYRLASRREPNDELRRLYRRYSGERRRLAAELESEILRRGGRIARPETAAGALRRFGLSVRAWIGWRGTEGIAAECARGDDAALKAYRQALERTPQDLSGLIRRQSEQIVKALDQVRWVLAA